MWTESSFLNSDCGPRVAGGSTRGNVAVPGNLLAVPLCLCHTPVEASISSRFRVLKRSATVALPLLLELPLDFIEARDLFILSGWLRTHSSEAAFLILE